MLQSVADSVSAQQIKNSEGDYKVMGVPMLAPFFPLMYFLKRPDCRSNSHQEVLKKHVTSFVGPSGGAKQSTEQCSQVWEGQWGHVCPG